MTQCGCGSSLAEHGGALVEGWKLFGAASLFNEAAE
jgi:hypothetical protein